MSDQPDTRDFERSFERPVAGRTPDEVWDEVLERMDLDASEVEAAQERLRVAEAAPLDAGWIERTTAAVTASRAPLPFAKRLPRRLMVASFLLLAAAIYVAVLVWPSGQHSSWTMSYSMAVKLLQQQQQPETDYADAMKLAFKHIQPGVECLRQIARDQNADPRLVAAAKLGFEELRDSLSIDKVIAAGEVDSDPAHVSELMADTTLSDDARLRLLLQMTNLMQAGIRAIKHAAIADGSSLVKQQSFLRKLKELLAD